MTLNPADLAAACLQAAADDPGAQSRCLAPAGAVHQPRCLYLYLGVSSLWHVACSENDQQPETIAGRDCHKLRCRVEAAAEAFLQMSQQQVAVPLETLVQTFINAVTGAHVSTASQHVQTHDQTELMSLR